jgi:ATPase subunit of ABC transporter with duplicated ATPase domains
MQAYVKKMELQIGDLETELESLNGKERNAMQKQIQKLKKDENFVVYSEKLAAGVVEPTLAAKVAAKAKAPAAAVVKITKVTKNKKEEPKAEKKEEEPKEEPKEDFPALSKLADHLPAADHSSKTAADVKAAVTAALAAKGSFAYAEAGTIAQGMKMPVADVAAIVKEALADKSPNAVRVASGFAWCTPVLAPLFGDIVEKATGKITEGDEAISAVLAGMGPVAALAYAVPVIVTRVADKKWKNQVHALALVPKVLERLYENQEALGRGIPQIIPGLVEAVKQARAELKTAGAKALETITGHITNPEITALAPDLLKAICEPSKSEYTEKAMKNMAGTTFMNMVDAQSLALLYPILTRAFRERSIEARRVASQVLTAVTQLVLDDVLLEPYFDTLVPLLQDCAVDPTYEVSREAGKALANICKISWARPRVLPWIIKTIGSKTEADRAGAGYCLAFSIGIDHHLPVDIPALLTSEDPFIRDGALRVCEFLPVTMTTFHTVYPKLMPLVLQLHSDGTDLVNETAARVSAEIVKLVCPDRPALVLSAFTPQQMVCENSEGRLKTVETFNVLCDELFDNKLPGGDLLASTILPQKQKEIVASFLYMLRSDPERAVARMCAQIWHKCIANGPKTSEVVLPYAQRHLAVLRHSGATAATVAHLISELGVDEAWVPPPDKPKIVVADSEVSESTMAPEDEAVDIGAVVNKATSDPFLQKLALEAHKAGVRQGAFKSEMGAWADKKELSPVCALLHNEDAGHAAANELLRVENLLLMYGGGAEPLLKDTTLRLEKGKVYGVVGRNGCGKTTLMKMLHSKSIAAVPKHLRFAMVSDQKSLKGADVLSCIEYCMQETLSDEAVAIEALTENGFDQVMMEKRVNDLSGGWKMRLLLTNAMMFETDVLLLDEPTNHLDVNAIAWLERYVQGVVKKRNQTIMVISHEPKFLNEVCTHIMQYTAEKKLKFHEGNFEAFMKNAGDVFTAAGMEELLGVAPPTDFNPPKRSASRLSMPSVGSMASIASMQSTDPLESEEGDGSVTPEGSDDASVVEGPRTKVKLSFPVPGKLTGILSVTKPIMEMSNVWFGYNWAPGMPYTLTGVSGKLTLNSRVALVGPNGAGKSTFMNLLCGELTPCTDEGGGLGTVYQHQNLRLAYVNQQHVTHLGHFLSSTPLTYIQYRYRFGEYDELYQKRLMEPQNEEQEKLWNELATKYGKYGKRVSKCIGRQVRGKELYYEVEWQGLDDAKQNTYEPLSKLKMMGAEGQAKAYDCRLAAQQQGNARPITRREISKHLALFGMDEELACNRPISGLSAGQKSKLTLAAAFWTKPHLIALDEPTNYIDQETLDALTKAIQLFKGGVVVISHAEDFVRKISKEIWHVNGGKCRVEKL